jgi:hypothetical protein
VNVNLRLVGLGAAAPSSKVDGGDTPLAQT